MGTGFDKFREYIDITNSQKIIDTLSSFGDDKATGNRSAGSKACTEAANYLYEEFQRIGLKNVTADKFYSSGWTYNGASILYKDENGLEKKIILGGYATNIEANNLCIKVVDAGKGRVCDYKTLCDVTNKLVLINIELGVDFWVSYPAYEAYLKEAKAVLVVTKYPEAHDDYLISQPIEGPAYAPALAITERDYDILKKLINKSPNKEVMVKLNAHSYVEPRKTSYNIWGEILGETDEVIYLIAHYDGYYHSYFDDASGVSTILGIAKAIIDSGYKPNRTIRVVVHGAEEWGRENSDYDWAKGAYEEIMHIHPEWAEKAFALINIDGNFPVAGEKNFEIKVSSELLEYIKESTKEILADSEYKFDIDSNNSTWSEEFSYAKAGVPCITARDSMQKSIYYNNIYHSSMDSKAFGFDEETYRLNHLLYGKILFDLDSINIRPMDFCQRFKEMKESLDVAIVGDTILNIVDKISSYAQRLTLQIDKLNAESNTVEKSDYNLKLFKLYKRIQASLVRLNWDAEIVFPHENYQKNIILLIKAIEALKNESEDLEKIVDDYIKPIDFNKYVYDFDRALYNFFSSRVTNGNRNTWGYKLVEKPNEDLYKVAQSLRDKFNKTKPSVQMEIKALEIALIRQTKYLEEIVCSEISDIIEIQEQMKNIISY